MFVILVLNCRRHITKKKKRKQLKEHTMPTEERVESSNVKVMTRVRLFNKREYKISALEKKKLRPCVRMRGKTCAVLEYVTDDKGTTHEREMEAFDFDECFWSMPFEQFPTENTYATQQYVYDQSGLLALKAAIEGFHVCIFAYGQTGSGKTYSMLGTPTDPGISPRLVDDLFAHVDRNSNPALKITVECMFFEIYNEKVRDLFNKKSKSGEYENPRIRTHQSKGVYVEGLLRKECTDAAMTKALIEKGTEERAVAETQMNAASSRSHAIFQIVVHQMDGLKGTKKTSYINLVDLAGSERIQLSKVQGSALVEATNINKSLSTLRRVIDVLIENSQTKKQQVPPFRESILTYVLSDSLGGNSKSQMIATISPHEANIKDTVGTLRYALRAKAIVCEARVNEEEASAMMDTMREEILRLRQQMRDGVSGAFGAENSSAGFMSEDMQRELQEKEAEMAKMEEEQTKMTELMADLKSQMKEMDEAKQELAVQITESKRERFAAAFRNAFLIQSDKKRIQEHVEDLTRLREEAVQMKFAIRTLTHEAEEMRNNNAALLRENDTISHGLHHLREEYDATLAKWELQHRSATEIKASLESQLEAALAEKSANDAEADRQKKRLNLLTADLMGLKNTAEREAMEKTRVRSDYEAAVMEHMSSIEAMRKKKEHYKQQVGSEQAKSRALDKAISTRNLERTSLLETIRALQALVKEKDFLVSTAHQQCAEAQERYESATRQLSERDETIAALRAALAEYEGAAQQWMSDLSIRDREVSRLKALTAHDPSQQIGADMKRLQSFVASGIGSGASSPNSRGNHGASFNYYAAGGGGGGGAMSSPATPIRRGSAATAAAAPAGLPHSAHRMSSPSRGGSIVASSPASYSIRGSPMRTGR
jgi:chromosome segregation ATPase